MARKSIVYFSLEIEGIMDALGFSLATKKWLAGLCSLMPYNFG